MLRLALEIPTQQLARLSPMLDFDFILAHKVLNDPEYALFFSTRQEGREVLLDNSTHEFGRPLPLEDLQKAVYLSRADVLIAPDIVHPLIDDAQYYQNLQWLAETAEAVNGTKIGAVLCGPTPEDLTYYIRRVVGLADVMCFTFHEPKRLQWWEHFTHDKHFYSWTRVHILGMASFRELREWVKISNEFPHITFSFDTSKPLKFGAQHMLLEFLDNDLGNLRGGPIRSKEVLDLKHLTEEQLQCVEENIKYLKAVCRGEDDRS